MKHYVYFLYNLDEDVPLSEDTRAKISAATKGRPAHNKGAPQPDHVATMLRTINKGRKNGPPSEETRAKISAARLAGEKKKRGAPCNCPA